MSARPRHQARRRPTIEVLISAAGEVHIEAAGYEGAGCEAATRFLEEALGAAEKRTRKPEFYQSRAARASRQRLGGAD